MMSGSRCRTPRRTSRTPDRGMWTHVPVALESRATGTDMVSDSGSRRQTSRQTSGSVLRMAGKGDRKAVRWRHAGQGCVHQWWRFGHRTGGGVVAGPTRRPRRTGGPNAGGARRGRRGDRPRRRHGHHRDLRRERRGVRPLRDRHHGREVGSAGRGGGQRRCQRHVGRDRGSHGGRLPLHPRHQPGGHVHHDQVRSSPSAAPGRLGDHHLFGERHPDLLQLGSFGVLQQQGGAGRAGQDAGRRAGAGQDPRERDLPRRDRAPRSPTTPRPTTTTSRSPSSIPRATSR